MATILMLLGLLGCPSPVDSSDITPRSPAPPLALCGDLAWGAERADVRAALGAHGVVPQEQDASGAPVVLTYPWAAGRVTLAFSPAGPWRRCAWVADEGMNDERVQTTLAALELRQGPPGARRSTREMAWEQGSVDVSLLARSTGGSFTLLERWEDPEAERLPDGWRRVFPASTGLGDPWPRAGQILQQAGYRLDREHSASVQVDRARGVETGLDVFHRDGATLRLGWRQGRVSVVESERRDLDEVTVQARWSEVGAALFGTVRDRQEDWWGWSLEPGTLEVTLNRDRLQGSTHLSARAQVRGGH